MQSLSPRASWWMTGTSYVWVWGVLSMAFPSRPWLSFGVALGFGVAAWVTTQHLLAGVLLNAVGLAALGVMGIAPEDATLAGIGAATPALLGPLFVTLMVVGYVAPARRGVWAVPFLLVVSAVAGRWGVPNVIFGGLLLILPWWFAVQVRLRDEQRQRAADDADRLSLVDPSVRARRAAEVERVEVVAAAFDAIGDSLDRMTGTAQAARVTLDGTAIGTIHDDGARATRRLRALLEVLREDVTDEAEAAVNGVDDAAAMVDGADESESARRIGDPQVLRDWWPTVLLLIVALTSPWVLATLGLSDGPVWPPATFLLLAVGPLAVAMGLRNRFPVAVLVAAAVVLVIVGVTGAADFGRDFLVLNLVGVYLSWAAGRAGKPATLVAWLAFSASAWVLAWVDVHHMLWVQVALHVMSYGAATVWSGHHAEEAEHRVRALRRQAEIEAAEQAAVARERLQLARDLHDAASHAVGTMMMQANAAQVLRTRDPEGARAALDAVADIGREAGHELLAVETSAASTLTAPAIGDDGSVDVAKAIAPLVAAARRSGAQVSLVLDLRTDPALQDVVLLLRVVREGLANAVRHAPGSEVSVEVSVAPAQVTVAVDNGPGRRDPGQDGPVTSTIGLGLGLRGLRELLAERGGDFEAGAQGDHFELRASFPAHTAAPRTVQP